MDDLNMFQDVRFLKASDIARILNISRAMAYRLMQRKEIPIIKINHAVRVNPADLEDYIKRCRECEISSQSA